MSTQAIMTLLDPAKTRLIVMLCHHNADPDAIGAAYALSSLLTRLHPQTEIEVSSAEGPSRLSRHILSTLPLKLKKAPNIEEADVIILLDTNTIQQLGSWAQNIKTFKGPILAIDHHACHPQTQKLITLTVGDDEASSTCEIVFQLFNELGLRLTEMEATALLLGIAFDTCHFAFATSTTLKVVAEISSILPDVRKVLSLLSLPMEESERMARLKASKRVRLIKLADWITAFSKVSTYQASAARALLSLGAHMAVVAGQRGGNVSVSLRASQDFYDSTKIHLGRSLAQPLGDYLNGMGGGHAVAAGANGVGDADSVLTYCVDLLKKALSQPRATKSRVS
ncbi:MAG: DHH family phosphoesterase [Candidatus Bathyarchaeota archaeon]|nr:MAG: DHH family phosphoesterase [Candidatus Bathyarchaeota archaeon]